jgi:hypothetical protein
MPQGKRMAEKDLPGEPILQLSIGSVNLQSGFAILKKALKN